MKLLLKVTMIFIITSQIVSAEIILSEVLANEPSNRVLLEWFEVYNNADTVINLQNYTFVKNDDTLAIPGGATVNPNSYAVLCRRLEPLNGSDCFEYYWGDSSGTWGGYSRGKFSRYRDKYDSFQQHGLDIYLSFERQRCRSLYLE